MIVSPRATLESFSSIALACLRYCLPCLQESTARVREVAANGDLPAQALLSPVSFQSRRSVPSFLDYSKCSALGV